MGILSKIASASSLGLIKPSAFDSGGSGFTGALLSGIPFIGEGFAQQQEQNFNASQSAQQMAFQKMMSDTAHQREVEDLRKAGLNPILSGTGGAGASTPSGSSASISGKSGAGSSASFLNSMYKKEREMATASIAKVEQDEKTSASQQASNEANKLLTEEQTKVANANAKSLDLDLKLKSEFTKNEIDFEKNWGEFRRKLELINAGASTANQFKDLINPFNKIFKLPDLKSPTPKGPTPKNWGSGNESGKGLAY